VLDFNEVITQSAFGTMVGISQPSVSDLIRRGVLLENQPASVWLRAYCSHLREMAAGRATAGDLDLATERAALARAQREKIEMQNAVTRKELAPAYLLEEILASAGARMGAIFDAIPGAIRRRNQTLTAADLETIATEIAKARNIAAALTLDDLIDTLASETGATEPTETPIE
jgi:terminase small subunit / prophage DNA-packing protein